MLTWPGRCGGHLARLPLGEAFVSLCCLGRAVAAGHRACIAIRCGAAWGVLTWRADRVGVVWWGLGGDRGGLL